MTLYKKADAIFFLMKRLGFDPIKDIREQYELEQALDCAHDAAIEKVLAYFDHEGISYGEFAEVFEKENAELARKALKVNQESEKVRS